MQQVDVIEFFNMPEVMNLIENKDFNGMYDYLNEKLLSDEWPNPLTFTSEITSMLYECDIDPFDYLKDKVPDYMFAYTYSNSNYPKEISIPRHISTIGVCSFFQVNMDTLYLDSWKAFSSPNSIVRSSFNTIVFEDAIGAFWDSEVNFQQINFNNNQKSLNIHFKTLNSQLFDETTEFDNDVDYFIEVFKQDITNPLSNNGIFSKMNPNDITITYGSIS